jgi:hypothetical protein
MSAQPYYRRYPELREQIRILKYAVDSLEESATADYAREDEAERLGQPHSVWLRGYAQGRQSSWQLTSKWLQELLDN